MGDTATGIIIIVIGLVQGGSVFLGNFDTFSVLFDLLGVGFIARGGYKMLANRNNG